MPRDSAHNDASGRWRYADELSDKITALINGEIDEMARTDHFGPYEMLAGQLLALKAFLLTAPPSANTPPWFHALDRAVDLALSGIINEG